MTTHKPDDPESPERDVRVGRSLADGVRAFGGNWLTWLILGVIFVGTCVVGLLLGNVLPLLVALVTLPLLTSAALHQTTVPRFSVGEIPITSYLQILGVNAVLTVVVIAGYFVWAYVGGGLLFTQPFGPEPGTLPPFYADPFLWWMLACVLVGLACVPFAAFALLAAADGQPIRAALSTGWRAGTRHYVPLLGLTFASFAALLVAAVPLGVGLIPVVPIVCCVFAVAYRQAVPRPEPAPEAEETPVPDEDEATAEEWEDVGVEKQFGVVDAYRWALGALARNWVLWAALMAVLALVRWELWPDALPFSFGLVVFAPLTLGLALQHPATGRVPAKRVPAALLSALILAGLSLLAAPLVLVWAGASYVFVDQRLNPTDPDPTLPFYQLPEFYVTVVCTTLGTLALAVCIFVVLALADRRRDLARDGMKLALGSYRATLALVASAVVPLAVAVVAGQWFHVVWLPLASLALAATYKQRMLIDAPDPEPTPEPEPDPAPEAPQDPANPYAAYSGPTLYTDDAPTAPGTWRVTEGTGWVRVGAALRWAGSAFGGNWTTLVLLALIAAGITVGLVVPVITLVALPLVYFAVIIPFTVATGIRQTVTTTFAVNEARAPNYSATALVSFLVTATLLAELLLVNTLTARTIFAGAGDDPHIGHLLAAVGVQVLFFVALLPLWVFTLFYAADGHGIWRSLTRGVGYGVKNYFQLLGLALISLGCFVLGALPVGVGWLAAYPFSTLVFAHAYRQASRGPVPHSTA